MLDDVWRWTRRAALPERPLEHASARAPGLAVLIVCVIDSIALPSKGSRQTLLREGVTVCFSGVQTVLFVWKADEGEKCSYLVQSKF